MKLIGGLLGATFGGLLVLLLSVLFIPGHDFDGFARLGFMIIVGPVAALIGFILGVLYRNRLKDKREEEEGLMPDMPEKHPDDWRYH